MQIHARLEQYDPAPTGNGMIRADCHWRLLVTNSLHDEKIPRMKFDDLPQCSSCDEWDIVAVLDFLAWNNGWTPVSSDGQTWALLTKTLADPT